MGPLFRAVCCAACLMTASATDSKSSKSKSCSRKAVYSVNLWEPTDTTVTAKHVSCCLAAFHIIHTTCYVSSNQGVTESAMGKTRQDIIWQVKRLGLSTRLLGTPRKQVRHSVLISRKLQYAATVWSWGYQINHLTMCVTTFERWLTQYCIFSFPKLLIFISRKDKTFTYAQQVVARLNNTYPLPGPWLFAYCEASKSCYIAIQFDA